MSEMNSLLVLAKSEKAVAEAKLNDIEKYKKNPAGFESDVSVLSSKTIQELKKVETSLLQRKADLSSRYGSKHPSIINVNAELADLRAKLKSKEPVFPKFPSHLLKCIRTFATVLVLLSVAVSTIIPTP